MDNKNKFSIFYFCFYIIFIIYNRVIFSQVINNEFKNSENKMISENSLKCISCHKYINPGLVSDWERSLHAKITPSEANSKNVLEKKVSFIKINKELSNNVVGCYECHGLNNDYQRTDSFNHYGTIIHTIVSPADCQTCHFVEVTQYKSSKKASAHNNLALNTFYQQIIDSIYNSSGSNILQNNYNTYKESCYDCHGTKVYASGTKKVESKLGTVELPYLINWPNNGVGRINPDQSLGSCTSCHPRHSFSISLARHPYTCSQCHTKPDAPAFNVYKESKHGNILLSNSQNFDYNSVPWQIGKHITVPTCATCHMSLLVDANNRVIAERNHDFGNRLWVRIFGLIYAHPQPKYSQTYLIKNSENLQLPTDFDGNLSHNFLISQSEQESRKLIMYDVCLACHSTNFVSSHFEKLECNINATNKSTYIVTKKMKDYYWTVSENKNNYFDSLIEKYWFKHWFMYANTIRFAYAMAGATNFSSFNKGWFYISESEKIINKYLLDLRNNN